MKTLKLIGIAPLVLLAATSFAQGSDDKAVPRASGSGSSASAESRHTGSSSSSSHSGSSAAQSDSGRRSGGAAASNDWARASSSEQAAQRRPRPGTGTGDRDRYGNDRGRYYGSPYSYYYYDPYAYSRARGYGLYGYGYGYYDYGFGYGDYYGYYPYASYRSYRYRSGNVAQLRTLVEPSKARVYVDGYYAGIVDDFDGIFQRLNVSPGRHDITFKLEGYQSHTFAIYANRDQTLKLRWDMQKGSGETRDSVGEEYGPRSERDADRDRSPESDRDARDSRDDADRYYSDHAREVDSERAELRSPAPSPNGDRGELVLEVEPPDASVYVDGEFYGKASEVARLELPAGRHRVEVVRPGYRTEETEVHIDGRSQRITVKLDRR